MHLAYLAIGADGSLVADGDDEYDEVVRDGIEYIGSYNQIAEHTLDLKE